MLIFYTMEMAGNLRLVLERIRSAAARAGRDPRMIRLVAVSKKAALPEILDALEAGVVLLGENRVQEARDKIRQFNVQRRAFSPEWHLIGNLQKNKTKLAVQLFDLIHSLDSVDLADEINRQAERQEKVQRVLIQVKLSHEEEKHGVAEDSLTGLLEKVSRLDYLKLEGLMTMPPFSDNPEDSRPYFRKLKALAGKALLAGFPMSELSMGMTNDFEIAVEEGATLLRIGTALFGARRQGMTA